MEYYEFIHAFKNTTKIYKDTQDVDEYMIKQVNNDMIDGNTLRALRMLESIDNIFKRDYIMKGVLLARK